MRKRLLGRFGPLASGLFAAAALALAPAAARADEPAAAPQTETVNILDAAKAGDLAVTVRGAGESRVKFSLENKSSKRLNIVIPPGLVAASEAGQGGGGFQSMGLGVPTANMGGFGAFKNGQTGGFRSMPLTAPEVEGIAVSPGQSIDFPVPSVCLNYGLPTPAAKNVFTLKTVEDYTPDARVRRALKSLATLGTSQTVAQAAMWNVCNGMSFDQIGHQNVVPINTHELAQAARFVEALDSSSGDLVDPGYFQHGRILVRIGGEGLTAKDAKRLSGELEGLRVMGLPIAIIDDLAAVQPHPGTLVVSGNIIASKIGNTTTRFVVRSVNAQGEWLSLGNLDVRSAAAMSDLKGEALASDLGHAMARAYVAVAPLRRSSTGTTFKITNRLPMTIAHATLKAGKAGDPVRVDDLGIAPARSATAAIPAASAVIDSVELNGL